MKPIAFTIGLALLTMSVPRAARAQWTTGSGGSVYYNGGNVGIGTTSPADKFEALGGNGSFIVSSSSPTPNNGYNWAGLKLRGNVGGSAADWNLGGGSIFGGAASQFAIWTGSNFRLFIDNSGNVGIGTTAPQHLLQVAGTIGAQEILVTSTGADYVFDPGYRLKPLSEVADYIRANRHLPDIPSAAEIKQKGTGVGEMESKLLAKVEELTLHMIEQAKENSELREHMTEQERQNRELRECIARLEKGAAAAESK